MRYDPYTQKAIDIDQLAAECRAAITKAAKPQPKTEPKR